MAMPDARNDRETYTPLSSCLAAHCRQQMITAEWHGCIRTKKAGSRVPHNDIVESLAEEREALWINISSVHYSLFLRYRQ